MTNFIALNTKEPLPINIQVQAQQTQFYYYKYPIKAMSVAVSASPDPSATSAPVHQPGTRKKLENYSYPLDDIIGKGYSSQVYRGRNDTTNQPVAIKVIDMKMLKNDLNRMLLTSEIDNLKKLNNTEHILQLYDIFTTKNNTYLITELCDGDLTSKIKGKLTEQEVLLYMSQLLEGYRQLYNHHIIHRDLKPANILMKKGELKIADFGFSIKERDSKSTSKYNVGSPLYMPPESLRRNEYSYESDIWALGIICYEMLYCKTPWTAKTEKELVKKIQAGDIYSLIVPGTNPMLSEFIIRCLQCNKADRLSPDDLCMFQFQSMNIKKEIPVSRSTCLSPLEQRDANALKQKTNLKLKEDATTTNGYRKTITENHLRSMETQNATQFHQPSGELDREQRKNISRLLLAQIHFCRFLFKFIQRIRQNLDLPAWQEIIGHFASAVMFKINKVRSISYDNFINARFYSQYKSTTDYEKINKITEEYYARYSTELETDCVGVAYDVPQTISATKKFIKFLHTDLVDKVTPENIERLSQQTIILDYLITAYQLFQLIREGENYELFARKSKIEEIVEGQPNRVTMNHFNKICRKFDDLKL